MIMVDRLFLTLHQTHGVYSVYICLQQVVFVLDPVLDQVLELLHFDFDNYFIDFTLLWTSRLF